MVEWYDTVSQALILTSCREYLVIALGWTFGFEFTEGGRMGADQDFDAG